jgi:GH43 family beta-xylosidase
MPQIPHFRSRSTAALTSKGLQRTLCFETLERREVLSGGGLTGQYFHNVDFTGLAAERTEAVDFAWGAAAPAPGVQPDSFSVRWLGQVEARFSETYTLRTVSDEGVRLWVDGHLLIDNWTPHAAVVNSAVYTLAAGQRYDIRLEYFDQAGTAQMRLQWSSPSQPLEAIPAAQLYASPAGLRGEYSDDSGDAVTRNDETVDFDWGAGSPAPGIDSDDNHIVWTGYVRANYSEEYAFSILSGDAVRLWVGDELIIDNFVEHAPSASVGSKALEAGKWNDIRLEFADAAGDASVQLQWSSERETSDGQFEIVPAESLRAAPRAPLFFTNPLGQGQDPWVVQWQDSYLLVRSSGHSVWIDRAEQLQDVHASDPASDSVRAWTAPSGTNYSEQVWAPELHQINGKWYIYVAASDGDNATHRMHVLERDDPNPMGAFTYKGQLAATTDRWAIDGTVLQWQDQLYFVWSGWPGFTDGQQNLYIAQMSDPLTISGSRSILSTPQFAWEQHGLPINEGPEVLIHNGQLRIIYSASGYWSPNYALGELTYDGSGALLSAANWVKSATPVFQKTSQVVGVGHASFVKSPDGTQDWIVYHSHPSPGGDPDQRVIRIQPFTYDADGSPNFGAPLSPATSIEAPSGVPAAERSALPGDYDASGAVNTLDLKVFAEQFGAAVFPGTGGDGAGDGFVDGADFLLWQRQLGAAAISQASLPAERPRVDGIPANEERPNTAANLEPPETPAAAIIDLAIEDWTSIRLNSIAAEFEGTAPRKASPRRTQLPSTTSDSTLRLPQIQPSPRASKSMELWAEARREDRVTMILDDRPAVLERMLQQDCQVERFIQLTLA